MDEEAEAEEIEDSAVREMRRELKAWLARNDWETGQLISWLSGEGLPASDIEQEPYAWLLDGLPLADERYKAETELAARAARLLETEPDAQPTDERRDEWLYNLLMLCAGLSCPTQLADPLHAMFERRQLMTRTLQSEESWQSMQLPQALESALITNQRDERMHYVWLSMLMRREHETLTGDEYAGFEGVRLMPASSAARGRPALDAIGEGLAFMAGYIEERRDRRAEFFRLIERVLRTYPGRPTWDSDLVWQAHYREWPNWAVSCLPKMFVPLASEGGRRTALLWEVYLIILRCNGVGFEVGADDWLCQDSILKSGGVGFETQELLDEDWPVIERQMAKVTLSEEAFCFLQDIAYRLEGNRLGHALRLNSYKKVIAVAIDVLSSIELELTCKIISGYGLFTPEGIKAARDMLRGEGLKVMTEAVAA
ncbi:MAG TPA: hypothetical protein VGP08_18620 [Pyrinomonadaceae bacterium]|jgi:hypothetical protein|nr:hypothetical protein [Pyrinomonadaceae bacterium]